ncbi:uncharacterized protein LOC135833319 [Planococcus citri]|uniref:uncharacterized protein LOC135833319 n=1 Tax=Planococcus citri TaxID=170843 RepID=UPI0031F878DE
MGQRFRLWVYKVSKYFHFDVIKVMVVAKLVKERIKMLSLIYVTSVILGSFIKVSEVGGTNQIDADLFTTNTTGYGYQNFFSTGKQENDGLKLEFYVIAPRDGHILLSPEQSPTWESPVYEIVLGAGKNTCSVIRRKKLGVHKVVTYSAESLVSPDEWRKFWIEMKGNKIQVGRKDSGAFMEWVDPEPLPIKYYSFSCYNNALASWIIISSPSASAAKPEPPKNLCILSPCGPNSECRQVDDYVACSCKENYTGSPPQCRPECTTDFDCPQNKACSEQKCQDPCITACSQNAQCLVANHTPICSCLPSFTGNASVECVKEQQPPKDLCILSPCGPNSECRQIDDYVTCSCKENYTGSPPQCRPECTTDFECPQNKACIGQKCQDLCVAACGLNAQCLVTNHTRTCECLNGFIGDPLVKCVEEGQPDEKCRNIWITHDYKYEHFFPISKRDNNTIELKFKVKANRDANMVFTQNMYPIHGDPAYEVVLGDQNNTRSVIRRTRYHPDAVTTIEETALVSPSEWLEFWVKIEANTMEVGRKGKRAFMVLKDLKEMPIKYYSIAGWGNATVLWSLPCVDEKDFS